MPDNMSISVNGQSQVPPGFRFHPTEEELLQYYLRKKVAFEKIDLDVIQDVDLNKLEPWDIQEKCKIGSTPQNDWYFFSHKDKKYPTGTRTNRATVAGFWKATGRDKVIYSNSKRIGMRKTLVFYKGRAPHGQKSDWIMHEYRLDDNTSTSNTNVHVCNVMGGEATQEEGWVVCRVFKKKNPCLKSLGCPIINTTSPINSCDEGTLEQMLHYMSSPFRRINNIHNNNNNNQSDDDDSRRFLKLPSLQDSPNSSSSYQPIQMTGQDVAGQETIYHHSEIGRSGLQDWTALDRLVASHLNGQSDKQLRGFDQDDDSGGTSTFCCPVDDVHHLRHHQGDDNPLLQVQEQRLLSSSSTRLYGANQDYHNDCDLWSFAHESSNDQLCHLSSVPGLGEHH